MALSQMQTIQSLGNNLAIFQQEVESFGVPATEIRHLVGRIGELYACVITVLNGNGNQHNTRTLGSLIIKSISEQII